MSDLILLILPAWCMVALLIFLSAPLGSLMIWRNMSFFADTLAHGTLLGVAIASLLHFPLLIGVVLTSVLLVGVLWVVHDKRLPTDALLAMVASMLLCGGLVLINLSPELKQNLNQFLFGDILLVTWTDVLWVSGCVVIGLIILLLNKNAQLKTAINPELAQSEGINIHLQKLILMVLLAIFTAIALKTIGSLLIGALLVVPALSARLISKSPLGMIISSFIIAEIGASIGILASAEFDLASGACIVLTLGFIFLVLFMGIKAKLRFKQLNVS